jgi:hypothetical protein
MIHELRQNFTRLRGRLFELAEASGMSEKQEEAFKKLIRELTYDAQYNLQRALGRERDRVNGRG